MPDASPRDLLDAARLVAATCDGPYRPRAVALLARQALEGTLDDHWRARAPGVEDCTTRSQLICLPAYLGDTDLAEETSYTWWALSRACHHHPYDLAPNSQELASLMNSVERLVQRIT